MPLIVVIPMPTGSYEFNEDAPREILLTIYSFLFDEYVLITVIYSYKHIYLHILKVIKLNLAEKL